MGMERRRWICEIFIEVECWVRDHAVGKYMTQRENSRV